MRKILFLCLIILSSLSRADDYWVEGPGSDDIVMSYQKGSFLVSNTRAGIEIAVVVTRTLDVRTKVITLGKVYVTTADCAKGTGKVVTLNMDGEFRFENDFAIGAGSIASSNADMICTIYASYLKEREGKGI